MRGFRILYYYDLVDCLGNCDHDYAEISLNHRDKIVGVKIELSKSAEIPLKISFAIMNSAF